jgi:hypothetical protein
VTQAGILDLAPHHPLRLLAAGVPLTLILDLFSPSGPDSEHIAAVERGAGMSGHGALS